MAKQRTVYELDFTTIEECVSKHGKEQTLAWLKQGVRNYLAHKKQSERNQLLLEIAKKDPRFKDLTSEEIERKLKMSKTA